MTFQINFWPYTPYKGKNPIDWLSHWFKIQPSEFKLKIKHVLKCFAEHRKTVLYTKNNLPAPGLGQVWTHVGWPHWSHWGCDARKTPCMVHACRRTSCHMRAGAAPPQPAEMGCTCQKLANRIAAASFHDFARWKHVLWSVPPLWLLLDFSQAKRHRAGQKKDLKRLPKSSRTSQQVCTGHRLRSGQNVGVLQGWSWFMFSC